MISAALICSVWNAWNFFASCRCSFSSCVLVRFSFFLLASVKRYVRCIGCAGCSSLLHTRHYHPCVDGSPAKVVLSPEDLRPLLETAACRWLRRPQRNRRRMMTLTNAEDAATRLYSIGINRSQTGQRDGSKFEPHAKSRDASLRRRTACDGIMQPNSLLAWRWACYRIKQESKRSINSSYIHINRHHQCSSSDGATVLAKGGDSYPGRWSMGRVITSSPDMRRQLSWPIEFQDDFSRFISCNTWVDLVPIW